MGYIRALMGYGMVCEVAFQRVCLEEAALGGRAGSRFGPGRMGRVGVGPGSGPAGSGRAKLRSGWAGSNFGWVGVGSGSGGLGVGPGFFRPGRAGRLRFLKGQILIPVSAK